MIRFLILGILRDCIVVSQCVLICISLWLCWTFFICLLAFGISSLVKCLSRFFAHFLKWSCLSSYWVWSFLYILKTSIFIRDLTFKYFCPVCGNKDNFSPQKSHCCDSGMLLKLSPLLESKLSFLLKGHYNWANRCFLPPTYSEKRPEMADNYFFIFNFIIWSVDGIRSQDYFFYFPKFYMPLCWKLPSNRNCLFLCPHPHETYVARGECHAFLKPQISMI